MKSNKQTHTESKSVVPSKTVAATQPAALIEAVKEAAALVNTITENELEKRYALGELVLRVREKSKYGDKALAALAAGTNLDANTLHAHGAVVDTWSDKREFTQLAEQRGDTKKTYRLSWSHFVLLAGVEDGRTRQRLINTAFAKALSEKRLRAERLGNGPRRKDQGGDSDEQKTAPASVMNVATELVTKGEQLNAMLESSIDDPTPHLIAQLRGTEQVLSQLEALLVVTRSRIVAALAASQRPASTMNEAVAQILQLPADASSHRADHQGTVQQLA